MNFENNSELLMMKLKREKRKLKKEDGKSLFKTKLRAEGK